MIWCIWYADGSTVSSDESEPQDVLGYGLEVIAQPDRTLGTGNVGYLVLAGYDYYYWHLEAQEWGAARSEAAMWDLILHRQPITGICAGRLMLPKSRYETLLEKAHAWAAEMGFPPKSGFQPGEVRE